MKRVIYLTPTGGYSKEEQDRRQELINSYALPGIAVSIETLTGVPDFFDNVSDFDVVSKRAAETLAVMDTEVAAVIAAGALDPDLGPLRRHSAVPVIGPGEASLYVASISGCRLSVITSDSVGLPAAEAMVAQTSARPEIVSIRHIGTPVRQIVDDRRRSQEALITEADRARTDDSADAIYLGAMTIGTLGMDEHIRTELGMSVYNPIPISLAAAAAVANARP